MFMLIIIWVWLKVLLFPVKVVGNLSNTMWWVVDRTINADNAIYNYEWFKKRVQEIDVARKNVENTAEQFKELKADFEKWIATREEIAVMRVALLGQKNYVNDLIGEYNAKSSMANRAIFADWILPNFIEALTFQF